MDEARFDALARLAGEAAASRRGALRLLVGLGLGAAVVAPGGRSDAKNNTLGKRRKRKRKRCRKAGQTCVSFGQTLGNCCKYSSCQEVPNDQRQFCLCDPGFWDPNRTGFCAPIDCLGLQAECTTAENCCQDALSGTACAPIANTKGSRGCGFRTQPDPPSRCCLGENAICAGDCDCCGELTCQDGRCRVPEPVCLELSEACNAKEACCGGDSVRVTCDFIDPFKANGRCGGPTSRGDRCCTTYGWECQDACDCCGSLPCRHGTCQLTPVGQPCEETAECFTGTCQFVNPKPDGSCLIPGNLPPPQLCCFDEGGPCGDSCQCCGTLTCQDSVCSSFGSG
jgi:hypothetical protein